MKKSPGNAWIYKCNLNYPSKGEGYSFLDPENGFLANNDKRSHPFGGEEWIRSAAAWKRLALAQIGDLIFCHQTDKGGIVGLTMAASSGYPDRDGNLPDKCSTIDIGPRRVKFDKVVRIETIRARVGKLGAHKSGKSFSTFIEVEPKFVGSLLTLCLELNPNQKSEVLKIVDAIKVIKIKDKKDQSQVDQNQSDILDEPVRREMLIEAFERKKGWAKLARKVYKDRCMVSGCDFRLIKADGETFIEVHHIQPMYLGGSPNDIRNMCVLCPNHHRAIHYGAAAEVSRLETLIRKVQAKKLKHRG